MPRPPEAIAPAPVKLVEHSDRDDTAALTHLARPPPPPVRHTNCPTFFHKGPLPPIPRSVHHFTIEKREGGSGVRVWIDSVAGLLGLLDMGVVEIHPWGATHDDVEHPDFLVFDLDPGPAIEWE